LADFESAPDDNTIGHLFTFEKRLTDEPVPELLAEPADSWRAPENNRRRSFEIDQMLDRLLAAYVRNGLPTSSEIWLWARNVGGDEFIYLEEEARKAITDWVKMDTRHEIEIFDIMLERYQSDAQPWLPGNEFFRFARRRASEALLHHILHKSGTASNKHKRKWLERVAVHLVNGVDPEPAVYWLVYNHLSKKRGTKRVQHELCVVRIGKHQLRYRKSRIKERQKEEKRKQRNVDTLATQLDSLRAGKNQNLAWAADRYFSQASDDKPPSIHTIEAEVNAITADAIRDGWITTATQPIENLDLTSLGTAAGENKGYRIEHAVIAGIDLLLQERRLAVLATVPLSAAIIALKSSFVVRSDQRRNVIYDWAAQRLDDGPFEGAAALQTFWTAALDAGGSELDGLWQLTRQGRATQALTIAIDSILGARPAMHENALKHALSTASATISINRLQELTHSALRNTEVQGRQRLLWAFVRFALDPLAWRKRFLDDFADVTIEDVAFLDWDNGVGKAVGGFGHNLVRIEAMARVAGARSAPDDRFGSGRVSYRHHLADVTHAAITALSTSVEAQASNLLEELATETTLEQWRHTILHAAAQQARTRRDAEFQHPTASQVSEALVGGPPINASDLRAVAVEEIKRLQGELRTIDTADWKMFWNRDGNVPMEPLHENECRDYLLSRLRDRMAKYRITAAMPEAQRANDTRADILFLTGAGRNLPVEVKRHYHDHVWSAAATQLQGYASAPGSDGLGIYLVIWFGADVQQTPPRPDGGARPVTALEMEAMLVSGLPDGLRERTSIIILDVSRPERAVRRNTQP
jgi:hypothetical protein